MSKPGLIYRVLLPCLLALGAGPGGAKPADRCSDVAGHYRMVGQGQPQGDAVSILGMGSLAFAGSELRIEGNADNYLRVWVKSGASGRFPESAQFSFWRNQAYRCEDGWLVFAARSEQSWRTSAEGRHYRGNARLRLMRQGGQLQFAVEFSGREYATLYSYDSASVNLPKPFTRRTFNDNFAWPVYVEEVVLAEAARVRAEGVQGRLRQQLAGLLGGVRLISLESGAQGTQGAFSAARENEVVAFEDRLAAAGLAYRMVRAPLWSNQQYLFDLHFPAGETAHHAPAQPSAFRVQQELEKMRYSLVHVTKVEAQGDAYLATMNLFPDATSAQVIARVQANSQMFADMQVVSDRPHPEAANLRVVEMRLRLR